MKLEPCVPPLWANSSHAQTILGHLLPSNRLSSKGKRMEIEVSSRDRLVGFVEEGESNTVVYIFHGLAGSTDSPYMHRTSRLAQELRHTVFMFNHRGCGEGAGMAREPYHSGRGEDISAVIARGRALYPRHRHVAIGFSMSANALLILLSGKRGTVLPDAAICVNAPIDLADCSRLLSRGLNKIYDVKFYLQCKRDVLRNISDPELSARLPLLTSLYEFDELYTAPAGGFRNREEYYAKCSTHELLGHIQTPTIILTAQDDPFVPYRSYEAAKPSSSVLLHAEKHGGHMGYLTREKTPYGNRWQDYALREALRFI